MDNAFSRYMIGDKSMFLSLEEGKGGTITFGGGK